MTCRCIACIAAAFSYGTVQCAMVWYGIIFFPGFVVGTMGSEKESSCTFLGPRSCAWENGLEDKGIGDTCLSSYGLGFRRARDGITLPTYLHSGQITLTLHYLHAYVFAMVNPPPTRAGEEAIISTPLEPLAAGR